MGSVGLASGEQRSEGCRAEQEIVVRPIDAVAWTLYVPTLFDYRLEAGTAGVAGESARQRSIALYRNGQLAEALAELDRSCGTRRSPIPDLSRRLVAAGRPARRGHARDRKALRADPNHSDAHAFLAIIAVVENDKDRALEPARQAVSLDPASPAALIALSYAQQPRFDIDGARQRSGSCQARPEQRFGARASGRTGDVHRPPRPRPGGRRRGSQAESQVGQHADGAWIRALDQHRYLAARAAFERAIELDRPTRFLGWAWGWRRFAKATSFWGASNRNRCDPRSAEFTRPQLSGQGLLRGQA